MIFLLYLANAAYVALGLSDDNQMGDDLVIECVPQNGQVNMYSSLTSGKNTGYGVTRLGVVGFLEIDVMN